MAGQLISLEEAANLLKVSPAELNDMRSRSEIFGVRTGSTWKFKIEEVERVAEERGISPIGASAIEDELSGGEDTLDFDTLDDAFGDDSGEGPSSSILVSEVELGSSQSPSSTIIGKDDALASHDSDLVLASDGDEDTSPNATNMRLATPTAESGDLQLAAEESGLSVTPPTSAKQQVAAKESDLDLVTDAGVSDNDLKKAGGSDWESSGDSDVDLGAEVLSGAGESDLLLAGASDIAASDTGKLDSKSRSSNLEFATDDLDVDLTASGSALDLGGDDDLVLDGDSALDGDIALTGDSGINLAKPSDSGIDLASADGSGISVISGGESGFMLEDDDALQLESDSSGDALELPEDVDIVALDDDLADPDAATQLKSDEDFDLTPVAGAIDDESDSGSQVIALDTEALDADAPTQLGAGLGAAPFGMEGDEAIIAEEPVEAGFGGGAMMQQPGMAPGAQQQPMFPVQELPEAPYSVWQVGSLAIVALMLAFTGILMVDVVRNIWSFDQPYGASTSIMNSVIEALGIQ